MKDETFETVQQFMEELGAGSDQIKTWVIGDRKIEKDPEKLDDMRKSKFAYFDRDVAPPIFELEGVDKMSYLYDSPKPEETGDSYDLIFAQMPLGYKGPHRWLPNDQPDPSPIDRSLTKKMPTDLALIAMLTRHLSAAGMGFFTVTGRGIWGPGAKLFRENLEANGFHINGYVELPKDIYTPTTSINLVLVVTSRIQTSFGLFSLRDSSPQAVALDLKNLMSGAAAAANGTIEEFKGFESLRAKSELERLTSIYSNYSTKKFGDLVIDVAIGKKGNLFPDWDNCIHLQLGSGNVRAAADTAKIKDTPSNVLLRIDPDIEAAFIELYLSSPRGLLSLQSSQADSQTVRVGKLQPVLDEVFIPIPSRPDRLAMLDASNALKRLSLEIERIQEEIVLNPLSAGLNDKVQQMLAITAAQTEGDKLKTLILRGESKELEFKQTFQRCINSKQKETHIETMALKTLVGFLNTRGGTLLIGVEDSGEILGIGVEREKHHKNSNDKFMLHLKDKIKSRIGIEALQDIDIKFVEVGTTEVLRVDCQEASDSMFLDGKDFYVRNPPATEKLEGKELANYLKKRFPSS